MNQKFQNPSAGVAANQDISMPRPPDAALNTSMSPSPESRTRATESRSPDSLIDGLNILLATTLKQGSAALDHPTKTAPLKAQLFEFSKQFGTDAAKSMLAEAIEARPELKSSVGTFIKSLGQLIKNSDLIDIHLAAFQALAVVPNHMLGLEVRQILRPFADGSSYRALTGPAQQALAA